MTCAREPVHIQVRDGRSHASRAPGHGARRAAIGQKTDADWQGHSRSPGHLRVLFRTDQALLIADLHPSLKPVNCPPSPTSRWDRASQFRGPESAEVDTSSVKFRVREKGDRSVVNKGGIGSTPNAQRGAAVCRGIRGGCLADPAGAAAEVPRQVLGSELRRAPVVRRRRQPPSSPRLWDPRRPWRGGGPHGPHQARTPGGRQPIARPEGHRPSLAHGTPPTSSIRFVAGVRLRGRETGSQCSEGANGDIGKDHRIVSRVGERRHDLETSGSQLATTRDSQHPAPPNGTDGAAQRHQIVLGCPEYRDAEEPVSSPAVARGPLQYSIGRNWFCITHSSICSNL